MAQLKWIGSFADIGYGIDDQGELFESIAEAKRALDKRYRANGATSVTVTNTDGTRSASYFPNVTPEARILLWPLPEPTTRGALEQALGKGEYESMPDAPLMAPPAAVVVWIGRRHGIRHGSTAEWLAVDAIRKGQDVREAGSIVVTG